MAIISQALTTSITGTITGTTAVDFMPSIVGSNTQWLLRDVTVSNLADTAETLVEVLGGADVKWALGVGPKSSESKTFDPSLEMGEHNKVALKLSDAAEVTVAARFTKGSTR